MSLDRTPISVLCVNDDPGLLNLTATFLERYADHFSVTTATSAHEGLELLGDGDRDIECIVSDYDMPAMNGLAFLVTVRAAQPDLPFILFTGRGSEEVASDAISAGVTDYMQKGAGTDQYAVLAQCVQNVVERFRARTQLDQPQQRAQIILDSSPDPIMVSVNAEYVYVNPAAAELFNADSEDALLGRSILDLVHPEDRDAVRNAIDPVQAGDQTVVRTRRTVQTLDGEAVPIEVTVRDITWNGKDGIVAILRDISVREQAQHEQARYRAAFENALDAIVLFDDDRQFIDVNQSACELYGRDREELLGTSLATILPDEFDFEAAWSEFKTTDRIRETAPIQRPNGEHRLIEYAVTADIVPGEHLGIIRDVTEREQRERNLQQARDRFQSVFEHSHDAIVIFDPADDEILEANPRTTELLGYPREELLSLGPSDIHPEEMEQFQTFVETVQAEGSGWTDTLSCLTKSGRELPAEISASTLEFDGRESVLASIRDVSDLRKSKQELERQNQRLEEFASIVSHDLRNPLSVARGYTELAHKEGNPEHFERIEHSLDRIERIIEDVLWLAREGREIGTTETVELANAIEDSWKLVAGERTDADLVCEEGSLGTITADYERLCQLLENVLGNAIKHGDPDVTVRVEPIQNGFAIEDDGPGIPPSVRERVFKQGFSTAEDGTGFGLYIVKQIAEAHGWEVGVTDSETGGTRIEFTGVNTPQADE